ncbi:hypothetical protein SCAR479_00378 [Seiridium cardinale]|uniref:Uncharacterized protein n=1 Tax=Seiridium cardinale TaxID=138064 RepID=A0ABR2Y9C1_9PEZI
MASSTKIILITGANSGIGLATSLLLARSSPEYDVIMGVRSMERGLKALAEIESGKRPGTVSLLELDVTSDKSIEAAVKKLTADFGVVDVLINNAGFISDETHITRQNMHSLFDTNVCGPVLLTQALEGLLQASKNPRIINISSSLGSLGLRLDQSNPGNCVRGIDSYRASKTALNMVSANQLWNYREWEHPPKVFSFCPGYVVTNLEGEAGKNGGMASKGAKSTDTSAQGILEIIRGERDGEIGQFITPIDIGKSWSW